MASVINTNLASLNTQRNLSASQSSLNTSLQRLSSGLRINSSKDDAAGLAIATRMDSQVRGQQVAIRNANDAISFAQVAEGGLSKQTDALQRMRELAVQSINGTNTSTDRANLDAEFTQLSAEVSRLSTATKFNGTSVFGAAQTFQVGADAGDTITTASVSAATITGNVSSVASASTAITAIDAALTAANTSRATLGAIQNRFESVVSNLQISVENQSSAKSRIMDADFAAETANLTRGQILQQAGTAMLAQANSLPNNVLSLLRG
ncbi:MULTISPECIES: flagellin [Methylotenera]|jgi:flagellin|uniref:Flagellin n=1 Tax=Methylotenera oryzisoli TaxID=2080758 RepID=A0A4Y9VRN1_9PROT|nr:flagellin [Methylotenera oryzisoli]TFW71767.1 flagellin FliC [Methylotenera oryzisoli]